MELFLPLSKNKTFTPNFQIGREARALRSDVVVVATYFYLALRGELLPVV